ncbi:MAG: AsmA family protein [Caulobacteraceae bacterium]|nr:AsmA family protein [Caulobacteraceae bacterium]
MPLGRPGPAEKITAAVFLLLVAALLVFLALFDWNWLRGPIGAYASARWDRRVELRGDLDVDLFRWAPTAHVNDLRIGPPAWGPRTDTADIARLDASVKLLPLLVGEVTLPQVRVVKPRLSLYRDADGRESWRFGSDGGRPMKLPLIQRFLIEDGRIDYLDVARHIDMHASINSHESAGGRDAGFRLEGRGTLNRNPLRLTVTGGPLINVRRDRPYRFRADLRGGATTLLADGQITRPFDLGHFTANLTLAGPDLADLYYLTTLTAPNTPPYRIRGRLTRQTSLWRFEDFRGRVGDSDLSGDLSVRTGKGRKPYLKADLRSRSLDMDDLMAVLGGAPSTGPGETASPGQRAMAAEMRSRQRLLPDAPLDVKRLRSMDADVSFRAGSVKANRIQLRTVRVEADLRNAVLRLEPFGFTFSRGSLNGTVRIDARKDTPFTSADLSLKGYPLAALFPARGGAPTLSGTLNARARLAGSGASVHDAASHAAGSVRLSVPQGQMRQAFAELLGINVGRGLFLLLSHDPRQTPIRCAVADFEGSGGRLQARRLVIDTGVVVANGSGYVNLGSERLHLRIDGDSKKPRLLRLWAPITVDGPLSGPRLGVDKGEIVKQGAVAGVLGAVINPLAALIPFLEPGGAKDVNCAALLGR